MSNIKNNLPYTILEERNDSTSPCETGIEYENRTEIDRHGMKGRLVRIKTSYNITTFQKSLLNRNDRGFLNLFTSCNMDSHIAAVDMDGFTCGYPYKMTSYDKECSNMNTEYSPNGIIDIAALKAEISRLNSKHDYLDDDYLDDPLFLW